MEATFDTLPATQSDPGGWRLDLAYFLGRMRRTQSLVLQAFEQKETRLSESLDRAIEVLDLTHNADATLRA